jgi:serine/threonine protein kinase
MTAVNYGGNSPLTLSPLRLSPSIDDVEQLGMFLTSSYHTEFIYDEELIAYTYRRMEGYTHIFEVNVGGERYIVKFSSDPLYKSLIQHEWNIYDTLYDFDDYDSHKKYFIEGVEGGDYKGCAYMIVPYLPSKSLEGSIQQLSNRRILEVLREVIDGLDYLLSHDICHGDMHSGNILLTRDSVKIIDFDKAGGCNETMNVGYRTFLNKRKALRKDINFIGTPYPNITGFFLMCKDIFKYKGIPTSKLDEIIKRYLESSTSQQDIHAAYISARDMLYEFTLNGGRRKTRRKVHRKRKTLHLHATSK